jgi:glyoxylase-like metal-dependent hydrolase (beta-lactamase superfamily II)
MLEHVFQDKGITVFQSALFKTNTTVIFTADYVAVVDPNWLPEEVMTIREWVKNKFHSLPVFLVFTHSDYDHIIGYKAFPTARVVASEAFVKNPDKDRTIEEILKFDHDYYLDRPYPVAYPKVDHILKGDRGTMKVPGDSLSYLFAPGHNRDGIIVHSTTNNVVVLGDYLSDVEFPFVYHSFAAYKVTLNRLKYWDKINEETIFVPGHGAPFKGLNAMAERLQDSMHYLELLTDSVIKESEFPDEWLWSKYKYRKNQENFHRANMDLLKKELGKK